MLHTKVSCQLHFHKASTLQRMGKSKETEPIFQQLWEEALELDDKD